MVDHDPWVLEATETDAQGQENDRNVRSGAGNVPDSNEERSRQEGP